MVLVLLAWTGHLIHVAIPESRGSTLVGITLTTLPHPEGLNTFLLLETGVLTAEIQIQLTHFWYKSKVQVLQFLTFLGGFHPKHNHYGLTDIAHHHLAIAVVFILLVTCTVLTGVLVTA